MSLGLPLCCWASPANGALLAAERNTTVFWASDGLCVRWPMEGLPVTPQLPVPGSRDQGLAVEVVPRSRDHYRAAMLMLEALVSEILRSAGKPAPSTGHWNRSARRLCTHRSWLPDSALLLDRQIPRSSFAMELKIGFIAFRLDAVPRKSACCAKVLA